jgi:SSS family solute:Na+ symporter
MIQVQIDHTFWWLLTGYGALLIGVSFYFTRFIKSSEDFYGSTGQTAPWLSGLSFFMSAFSASVFVANASLAYRHGSLNLLLILAQLPVFIAGYYVFSRRWFRSGCSTVIEFLQKRFGLNTAKFFLWMGIPIRVLENGNRVYVTAVLFEIMLGIDLFTGATITVIVALLSTVGGGFLAVVVTDAVQAILLSFIVAVVAVLSWQSAGGWEGFATRMPENYWSVFPDQSNFGLSVIVAWSFVALFAWNGSWSLVQRFVAVPTEKGAQRVSLISGGAYYLLFPLMAIPAMAAAIVIPELDTPQKAEYAYILMAEKVLPMGLMAMLCFGLLGATITALNAELNVMAQVVVQDMLKRRLARFSESTRLWFGRIIMIALSALCLALALRIREMGGAFQFLITVLSMTALPTFIPMLLGLLTTRGDGRSAISAFIAGMITSIILKFGFDQSLAIIIATNGVVTASVFLFATSATQRCGGLEASVQSLFARIQTPKPVVAATKENIAFTRVVARVAAITLIIAGLLSLAAEFMTPDTAAGKGYAAMVTVATFVTGGAILFFHRAPKNQ